MDSEIQKIKEDVELSGFPLEIEASSILLENDWSAQNQAFYVDEEKNKTRTVDIVASKTFHLKSGVYTELSFKLIIECKKSKTPWVFYTTPRDAKHFSLCAIATIRTVSNPLVDFTTAGQAYYEWQTQKCHHSYYDKNIAVNSYEPFKKGEGKMIITAVHQVTKATSFYINELEKSNKSYKSKSLVVFFPVIIFGGHLYEWSLKRTGPEITRRENFYYQYARKPLFLIDILELNYLKTYVKLIDSEMLALKDALIKSGKT